MLAFPIVGLGASAGGLQALQRFFGAMPGDTGMAFVVVMHLSPVHESNVDAILRRHTGMPVQQVNARVTIEANHVYVIPPNKDLSMDDDHLGVAELSGAARPHLAIDLFFRTLAQAHGARAMGAVLSGTGSDGAVGLRRIKEQGGVTLAQLPEDAEFDQMPQAAIATGMVDFVLPANAMPERLVELWRNAQRISLPETAAEDADASVERTDTPGDEAALQTVMALLRARTGHDFRHYKRATVLRRIARRLQVSGKTDLRAYSDFLRDSPDEAVDLLQDMLISVTNFFRDREPFDVLEKDVIPALFIGRPPEESLRVWVSGCATGEEAYTLSILLREAAENAGVAPELQIFATDIDERALAIGRAGVYPAGIAADVAPARLVRYFHHAGDGYRVSKAIREPVVFAAHNVLRDPPFSRLDIICCRNLLIYLGREAQNAVLQMFRFALKPGGYLVLGTSESADAVPNLFTLVDKKQRIYRANPHARGVRHLPLSSAAIGSYNMQPAVPHPAAKGPPSVAELHARALGRVAPPSVMIDQRHTILHLSEGAGRFFEHAGGVPTTDLLPNVHPSLRLELRTALLQSAQTRQRVEAHGVPFERDGHRSYVKISVCPVPGEGLGYHPILVLFEDGEQPLVPKTGEMLDTSATQVLRQLEDKVEQLKTQLRDTVEQADMSTEDLKASNEELQAINEELRSATEELETSKEELQSMNEELVTVNVELKGKVEETGKVNDDLQNFIVASDIATIFIDGSMHIKRFTPQAASIFNLIASDVDRPLLDLTHRLEDASLAEDIALVFQQLRIVERRVRSTDGRHYLARMRPYRTTDDKIAGAVLTFVDVTELRQAEQDLREGEERLRIAALTTRDYAIVTMDDAGIITTWNEGARRVFGHEDAEAIGQHIALIFTPEDRAAGAPEAEMRGARLSGRAEDERWHLRKNGSIFFCSGVMTTLRDSALTGFVKIARDITGSKQQEVVREALLKREQAANSEARSANELKDRFLAVMSHELKHPLNLIQVNAELLLRMPESRAMPGVRRAGESIQRAVRSQTKIIDDLLDLSRTRTGKLRLVREPVVVAETLMNIVDAAQEDAARKHILLHWQCGEPDMVVPCDLVRTEQIAWNLLNNAIKFTPAGGRITMSLEREGGFARLSVADSGIGIAPAFLPHVFGMFSQGAAPQGGRDSGLGIGLALVQELSVAQGGHVLAESAGLGQGATFSVWLPLDADFVAEPADGQPRSPLHGLRVLAVDDMPDALAPFAMVLESEGAVVDTAEGGAQALEMLGVQAYDLLLSDLGMPGMDGYELVAALRGLPALAHLRAVAVSGYGRTADVDRALQAGFDAHVTKPVDFEILKKVVEGFALAPKT
ncbi:MAG: chemotaxis protein CheB [Pseudomonadota bacterium]